MGWLQRFENWIDKKTNKLDREHRFLRTSEKGWHRWLWKVFFKPSKKTFDLIINSPPVRAFTHAKSKRIIHVVNLLSPHNLKNRNLAERVALTLESIEKADRDNVILLGCTSAPIRREGWQTKRLDRTAKSELGNRIDSAFLKDMLLAADSMAKEGDIILYSNLDCPVHPDIYKNLLTADESITEFIRRDVEVSPSCTGNIESREELFSQPFKNYTIGVDGLALKKEALHSVLDLIPDFVIGEPHWDTAISGILHQAYGVVQNTQDLYHIVHPQQWDDNNLSKGGAHNKKLYREAVEYGLMEDNLISIKKDCALVVLKSNLKASKNNTIAKQLRNLSFLQGRVEAIFCEYLEGESEFKKFINRISYLPIRPTNANVAKLNQKNAILNLLRHYFSNHKYIIIALEDAPPLNFKKIQLIKEQLRMCPLIYRPQYIALRTRDTETRMLDFYVENEAAYPTIHSTAFLNDDGLLELLNNYGYFQPTPLFIEGIKEQLVNQPRDGARSQKNSHRSGARGAAPKTTA